MRDLTSCKIVCGIPAVKHKNLAISQNLRRVEQKC